MATPTSTSIGVLGSLLCKLEGSRGIHYPLKAHLEEIHGYLNQLLWLEEPTLKQKSWMKEVRELSYDIDDYLDMNPNSTEKQVHDEFSTHLQEAIERYKRYNLHVSQLQRKYLPVSHHQLQRKYLPASHQPTQYTEVTDLFLDLEDEVVKCVMSDEQELSKVVAIVGPGGIGKTTLARKLYQTIGGEFDCQAFLRVTKKPDMQRLLKDMLSQLQSHQSAEPCGVLLTAAVLAKGAPVVEAVQPAVAETKEAAHVPRSYTRHGAGVGYRFHRRAAAAAACIRGSEYIFKMRYLSMDSSRKLFFSTAFGSEDNCPNQVRDVSLEIIERCEDYTILKDDLWKLWVAEGFITAVSGQDNHMEEAGKYFDELVNRRMIQPVDVNANNEVLSCTLHSMVLDLIANKSIENNFIVVLDKYQGLVGLPEKVRRLSLHFGNARHANAPKYIGLSQVRSLAFFGFYKCMPTFEEFELVRVLVLQIWVDNCGTTLDLRKISELHHLRYLKISCDTIIDLPTQIWQLQYLMTIEIEARAISIVQPDIVDLPVLSHLLLPIEADMPDKIGDIMSSLCTLGHFDLSKYSKGMVHSLGRLTNLQHLHLACSSATPIHLKSNLNTLGSVIESLGKLKSLTTVSKFLHEKFLTFPSTFTISWGDLSRPPLDLQKLEFSPRICTFSRLPNWIKQLQKLCTLKIAVHEMKDVGVLEELSALTILCLHVKNAPAEPIGFHKAKFPVLKFFKFICSVPLMEFKEGTMPNLQKLHLGFNAHGAASGGHTPVGMMHLPKLQLLSAVIGCLQAEQSDRNAAESAMRDTISAHGKRPVVNIRWVDWNFYPVYGTMSTRSFHRFPFLSS
ncbi:hypothetical protein HU200_057328 [Digitaria exilis]|uniref:Uncharacterized protein n=1 Tax=Digitaria exilis TaxID=1010633 RepID=A0A835ABI5_9POAL|nr:hypothetical protein HU200_057328 [Digitaria exilis]